MNGLIGDCDYQTPCGWCAKWDKKCDRKIPERGLRAKCHPVDDAIPKSEAQQVIDMVNKGILPPLSKDPTLEAIKRGEGLPPIETLDPDHLPSGLRKERRGV